MSSLNSLLDCNAILNLPLYNIVFPISMSSEYFSVLSFDFIFCYRILCPTPPPLLPRQQFSFIVPELSFQGWSVWFRSLIRRILQVSRSIIFFSTTFPNSCSCDSDQRVAGHSPRNFRPKHLFEVKVDILIFC